MKKIKIQIDNNNNHHDNNSDDYNNTINNMRLLYTIQFFL